MRAVKGTVDAQHLLSAVQDIARRAPEHRTEEGLVWLRVDTEKSTLTFREEEEDSVYKVTLPVQIQQPGEQGVIYCRLATRKLDALLPLLEKRRGELPFACRSTTLTFETGKRPLVLPNHIVEAPATEQAERVPSSKTRFGPQEVVRFEIADVAAFQQAVVLCTKAALPVRVGGGVVAVHTEEYGTEARLPAVHLWPREALTGRLAQLPKETEGVRLQVVMADAAPVYFLASTSPVVREIWLKPLPSTNLYIRKPAASKQSGRDASPLWTNDALLTGKDRKRDRRGAGMQEAVLDLFSSPLEGGVAPAVPPSTLDEFTESPSGYQGYHNPAEIHEVTDTPESQDSHEMTVPEPTASTLDQLEQLPGLAQVKKQIRDIAHFAAFEQQRLQVLRIDRRKPTLHMAFLGNPGTGKTVVARLIGRIFQELGLLTRGHVVEVDRQALVGAYMGHTEQNLAKAVKRALGGVLFIDEAYTLYKKDSHKDFGLTAINGLVKALEDHRDNLLVIVAGYRKEMQEFLAYNPGLRERIPFHLEFPDYSPEELAQIADYMAAQDHYELTNGARDELIRAVLRTKIDDTFSNARSVRNLLEKAKIRHAVLAADGAPSEAAYTTLTAEDFQEEEAGREESLQQLLAELDNLVGLDDVKRMVYQMIDVLALEKQRLAHGLEDQPLTLHMAFTGHPGTGKTTVARLIGKMLRALDFLPKGHFVEASRKDLVAGYVGQTAQKTADKIKEALGGVLFIDEAYAIARKGREEFGSEALATLIKEMEDQKHILAVILAGYTQQMEELFQLNPGLKSRVRFHLHFPDYTATELVEIVKRKASASHYTLTPAAEEKLWSYFLQQCLESGDDFGNGRLAENVFEQAKIALSTRISRLAGEVDRDLLMTITDEDLDFES